MRRLLGALTALMLTMVPLAASASGPTPTGPSKDDVSWKRVDIDTDQGLRGLDAVSAKVAWVAGSDGGVWRTVDAGKTWKDVTPAAQILAFRDVEATSKKTALVLAIGPGEESQILRTDDGGESWATAFVNDEPTAFYDCMGMPPQRQGRSRPQRPGRRRDAADPHQGRRQVVDPRRRGRAARAGGRRVLLRRERHLPGHLG
ncbi:hypothetical protein [Nocardioides sp. InS609-2]|uniref:WD40/YVTN/BNR-like repeat-containing protein n=1 Tax=Nocardioides sp. InS609-2 TaxID=2760705 RepID=UPI0020BF0E0B|nr:hypothetical protein [Nocardioides sp. InS609-2]